MTERLWAFALVLSFYGGTVFERKWWRWHRNGRSVVIEDHDLAEDRTFVSDIQRAIVAHCERRVQARAEDLAKQPIGERASDSR